jgi:hypothetical protein
MLSTDLKGDKRGLAQAFEELLDSNGLKKPLWTCLRNQACFFRCGHEKQMGRSTYDTISVKILLFKEIIALFAVKMLVDKQQVLCKKKLPGISFKYRIRQKRLPCTNIKQVVNSMKRCEKCECKL